MHTFSLVPPTPKPLTFSCPSCPSRFERAEYLRRHMRKHTGEKPYSCPHPGCCKSFSRKDNMHQHHKTHLKPSSKLQGRKVEEEGSSNKSLQPESPEKPLSPTNDVVDQEVANLQGEGEGEEEEGDSQEEFTKGGSPSTPSCSDDSSSLISPSTSLPSFEAVNAPSANILAFNNGLQAPVFPSHPQISSSIVTPFTTSFSTPNETLSLVSNFFQFRPLSSPPAPIFQMDYEMLRRLKGPY